MCVFSSDKVCPLVFQVRIAIAASAYEAGYFELAQEMAVDLMYGRDSVLTADLLHLLFVFASRQDDVRSSWELCSSLAHTREFNNVRAKAQLVSDPCFPLRLCFGSCANVCQTAHVLWSAPPAVVTSHLALYGPLQAAHLCRQAYEALNQAHLQSHHVDSALELPDPGHVCLDLVDHGLSGDEADTARVQTATLDYLALLCGAFLRS